MLAATDANLNRQTSASDWAQVWHQAKRILCVRLDSIGDVIMTTPALRALKESGDRQLVLLTSGAGGEIAPQIPELDDLIVYDAPWLKATAPRQDSGPEYAMIEYLRSLKLDGAVIFTVYSQNPLPSAFLLYMAGIPLRLAHCRENPYQLLTHSLRDPEPEKLIRHEVQRQLDLVASIGSSVSDNRLKLTLPPAALGRVQSLLAELGIDRNRPWLVIHPGATAPSRRYSPESFAAVAEKLSETAGIQILFTGTEPEQALVTTIRAKVRSQTYSLVGQLNLGELTALLSLAPVLISNNTGPVHIAAAVGTAVVDLYALTNPQHTPWGIPCQILFHDVPCRICYKSICPEGHYNCLRLLAPEIVVSATLELLETTQTNPSAAANYQPLFVT